MGRAECNYAVCGIDVAKSKVKKGKIWPLHITVCVPYIGTDESESVLDKKAK